MWYIKVYLWKYSTKTLIRKNQYFFHSKLLKQLKTLNLQGVWIVDCIYIFILLLLELCDCYWKRFVKTCFSFIQSASMKYSRTSTPKERQWHHGVTWERMSNCNRRHVIDMNRTLTWSTRDYKADLTPCLSAPPISPPNHPNL